MQDEWKDEKDVKDLLSNISSKRPLFYADVITYARWHIKAYDD